MEKIELIIEKLENLKAIFDNEKKEILKEYKKELINSYIYFLEEKEKEEWENKTTLSLREQIKEDVRDYIIGSNWIFKNWILKSLKKDYKKLIYLIINLLLDYQDKGICKELQEKEGKKGKCKEHWGNFELMKINKKELKKEIWEDLVNYGIIKN